MANNKEQKLMSEFPAVSTEQWEEVIAKDLKGADYEKKLVWKTAEGFNVRPYYRAEDLKNIQYLGAGIGEFPYVRSTSKCNNWLIQQSFKVKNPAEVNAEALKALNNGVEALGFRVKGNFDAAALDVLLKGIEIPAVEMTFSGCGVIAAAEAMIAKAAKENLPEDIRVNFEIDPLVNKFSLKGSIEEADFATIKALIEKASKYSKMRFVGVGGDVFHNSGSTIVQELAFTLAAGHEYLVKLIDAGVDAKTAAKTVRFKMAVSANYFMEMAKFRAARMLWANITKAYGIDGCGNKMFTHAVTSKWNMTAYDPYVNMLRGTTEAMSATIAGVHSLEVLPFNAAYEQPTEFSSRIARNVQLLLKHESHFDSVVDPSGGSYYIETLTQSIAEQAWALFKQVEEKGGYTSAFLAGFVQDTIEASAAKKDLNIATRREVLLGTNQYPNFSEVADAAVTEEDVTRGAKTCCCSGNNVVEDGIRTLKPYRGAMAFEEMRLNVDHSGKEPKVFMLTCGTLAFARARSQFSSNFFGCAGFRIIDNTFFKDIEEGIKEAIASKAEVVVICAADDDYAELAPKAYEALKDKAVFVVAGAPASQSELEAKGINNYISVKSNVLETLKYYLKELGI